MCQRFPIWKTIMSYHSYPYTHAFIMTVKPVYFKGWTETYSGQGYGNKHVVRFVWTFHLGDTYRTLSGRPSFRVWWHCTLHKLDPDHSSRGCGGSREVSHVGTPHISVNRDTSITGSGRPVQNDCLQLPHVISCIWGCSEGERGGRLGWWVYWWQAYRHTTHR